MYEEYGAKYELMIKDIASAHRTIPHWDSYQKGLEILATALGTANMQNDLSKKSLTIGDLLMKVSRSHELYAAGSNILPAYSTGLQVPLTLYRASQMHASV